MMPSVRQRRWNAASASSSVTLDVLGAADVLQQACSGPTPG